MLEVTKRGMFYRLLRYAHPAASQGGESMKEK